MKVLVVEDEAVISSQIQAEFSRAGFSTDLAVSGVDGYCLAKGEHYDAVVLDLGLPDKDGVSVLRDWRAEGLTTPVLILTARSRWQDRVEGLNAGGDDYLVKPFRAEELVARLRALVRRSAGSKAAALEFGGLSVNKETGRTLYQGRIIELTAIELKLLIALMQRPEKTHSKSALAETIYGHNEERGSNTVEVYVARLRRKIGRDFVRTVRGRGYTIGHKDVPNP